MSNRGMIKKTLTSLLVGIASCGLTDKVLAQDVLSRNRIVFEYREQGNTDIYIANVDDGQLTRLTSTPDITESDPKFSPDGSTVVFSSLDEDVAKDGEFLYRINADGSNLRQLTSEGWAELPKFSPDGKKISFILSRYGEHSLCIMNSDGSNIEKIVSNRSGYSDYSWSPHGEYIAYINLLEEDSWSQRVLKYVDIYVVNIKSGHERNITTTQYHVEKGISWSPDGSRIVFGFSDDLDPFDSKDIAVIGADGDGYMQLTQNKLKVNKDDWNVPKSEVPLWSPDGNIIAYINSRGSGSSLALINADGASKPERLCEIKGAFGAHENNKFSWSPDGKKIALTCRGIYIIDLDTRELKRLTNFGTEQGSVNKLDWARERKSIP